MEPTLYVLETLVHDRLAEARQEAWRRTLAPRPPHVRLRARAGALLIALGEWLRRPAPVPAAPALAR